MSGHSFWNNFTYGFLGGMFNYNPLCGYNMFSNSNFFNPFCHTSLFAMPNIFCIPTPNVYPPLIVNSVFNQYNNLSSSLPPPKISTSADVISYYTPPTTSQKPHDKEAQKEVTSINKRSEEVLPSVTMSRNAQELKARWKSKHSSLSNNFYQKVINIAKNIKCSPDDLMALMYSESRLNPKIQNSIGATGLIQFMPSTAKDLGTTTAKLKSMSAEKQLDYVEKYLLKQKKAAKYSNSRTIDAGTLYALTFLPAYSHREVLSTRYDKYYKQNSGLDRNKDGKITKTDLSNRLKSYYA